MYSQEEYLGVCWSSLYTPHLQFAQVLPRLLSLLTEFKKRTVAGMVIEE